MVEDGGDFEIEGLGLGFLGVEELQGGVLPRHVRAVAADEVDFDEGFAGAPDGS